jgi:hypothetical protein
MPVVTNWFRFVMDVPVVYPIYILEYHVAVPMEREAVAPLVVPGDPAAAYAVDWLA